MVEADIRLRQISGWRQISGGGRYQVEADIRWRQISGGGRHQVPFRAIFQAWYYKYNL
jgi:hypothetical protein